MNDNVPCEPKRARSPVILDTTKRRAEPGPEEARVTMEPRPLLAGSYDSL